jgi:peptidoglycan hydrolase CwlO-like protein
MTEQVQEEVQLDRKDLKIQHYQQKVAELEERISELRVDLTLYAQEVERLTGLLKESTEDAPKQDEDPAAD